MEDPTFRGYISAPKVLEEPNPSLAFDILQRSLPGRSGEFCFKKILSPSYLFIREQRGRENPKRGAEKGCRRCRLIKKAHVRMAFAWYLPRRYRSRLSVTQKSSRVQERASRDVTLGAPHRNRLILPRVLLVPSTSTSLFSFI